MTPKNTNNIDKSAPSTIIPDKIPKNIFTPFNSNEYGWLLQAILWKQSQVMYPRNEG